MSVVFLRHQWRIYIVKFWTRPRGPNSFNFMQFLGIFLQNHMLAAPFPPPPRVGAPTSGKSWIRHWPYLSLTYLYVRGRLAAKQILHVFHFTGFQLISILREACGMADPGEKDCQGLMSFCPLSFIFMQFCQKSCQINDR